MNKPLSNIVVTQLDMNHQLDSLKVVTRRVNRQLELTQPLSEADAQKLLDGCDYDTNNRLVITAVLPALKLAGFTVASTLFDAAEGVYSLSVSHPNYGDGFATIEASTTEEAPLCVTGAVRRIQNTSL